MTNREKFARKWARELADHRPNGIMAWAERDRRARRRVLVIDACMLTPDQDSGSVRMLALLEILIEAGCKVTFVADNLEYRQPYVRDLQQRGVEVLFHPYASSISELLGARGVEFDLVLIARHYVAAQAHGRGARVRAAGAAGVRHRRPAFPARGAPGGTARTAPPPTRRGQRPRARRSSR